MAVRVLDSSSAKVPTTSLLPIRDSSLTSAGEARLLHALDLTDKVTLTVTSSSSSDSGAPTFPLFWILLASTLHHPVHCSSCSVGHSASLV